MLGRRPSNSVAEEGGRKTGRTWTEAGQRRQAVSLARLHRLSTCPPGRSAGISYRPGHVCALLGAQRRGAQVSERAWLLQGKTLPLPRPELPRQATDEAGLSGALSSSSRDKSITGVQTPHRKYLAWERKPGGKRRITPALLIGISPSSLIGLDSLSGGANRKSTPSSALARLLLVQRHLRESGEIWLCLFLPVPSLLLSSPSTNQGQFQFSKS